MPDADSDREFLRSRYRGYLLFLAELNVEPSLRGKLDLEGVVQQTLVEAWQSSPQRAGWSVWLRRLLANNLADELRKLRAGKRDIGREVSLEANLAQSSLQMAQFLAADISTPSQRLDREERALRVVSALNQLPEAQREALMLKHWNGWPLTQIAGHMQHTPAAIAGLLKRGLRQMRELLSKEESPRNTRNSRKEEE